ncbi:uncharacterized protein LOC121753368 isoform X2 [Salvia splendens]|uniref:uncharacterized protein LOC121753368 isoform X2 n=1 Tax=Salvia splendens TaxID=180675 RepID=UPI001C272738|nr:uncharacterized protein LOC121753368 isoform X2 [Salvia splendens]
MVSRGIACVDCTIKCERSHGKQPRIIDRFFKIMFGKDCSQFLYLPPGSANIMKHLTNKETQIVDVNGQKWSVSLSLVKGSLAFKRGWQKFFRDHGLKAGELLVFEYYGESDFIVHIYGTSARERTNFNYNMARRGKTRGREPGTASEDESCDIVGVNNMARRGKKRGRNSGTTSEDESCDIVGVNTSNESISISGDEFQNRKAKHVVKSAGLGVSELLPIPVDAEDPICMINKSDWYHEQNRNSLYDLSFEMEYKTSDAKECERAVITTLDHHTETEQHDANLDNASVPKLSPSYNQVLELTNPAQAEQTKTNAENAQVAVNEENLITSKSGELSSDKLVKALHAKTALSHTENGNEIEKVDDTQIASHSHQEGGQSGGAFKNKFYEKTSDNRKMKKGELDNVCSFQDDKAQPISKSPFVNIAKSEHASVSSSTVKNPLGLHATTITKGIKMEDKDNVFPQLPSDGKEPPMTWNEPQMISPVVVKAEPDLPYETGQLDTTNPFLSPFTADIESKLYLELPVAITLPRGRWRTQPRFHSRMVQMIVYLRDSVRRIWPVVYCEYVGGRALTVNWTNFCELNNIKPGDNCRFEVEDSSLFVFRVDVTHGSG